MPANKPPEPTDTSLDIDGYRHGTRALVIKPVLKNDRMPAHESQSKLQEAVGLAEAIDLKVIESRVFTIANPSPATLFSSGLVEEIAEHVRDDTAALVVVDHTLSPVQQRNLEKAWTCKVIDRTGLILEIFGQRARTREGQLQVELAALTYQKSRLVRSWTHLERQRGGFGFMGGPGESQLEIDRRLITDRISRLKEDLEQVRRTRSLGREARNKAELPTVALVGYTNAGKSTLFNRLTGADVVAKNMLFATLDPSMRKIDLPSGREAILSDTVGFISDLPTHLVEAFRATLEEVQMADVILHVRDITHPDTRMQKEAVESVLFDLGIEQDDKRLIEVLNKFDLLPEFERKTLSDYASRTSREAQIAPALEGLRPEARGGSAAVSALTGEGMDSLLSLIDHALAGRSRIYEIDLPLTEGAALAWLYGHGHIISRADKKTKLSLQVALDKANYGRFMSKFEAIAHVKS